MNNPCSEIPLQNGRPSAVFYIHLEEPETEEQMILYAMNYQGAIVKTKDGQRHILSKYFKCRQRWFYEKYKLLFDEE